MKELKTKRLKIVPMTAEQLSELLKQAPEDAGLQKQLKACVKHTDDWFWYTRWQICLRTDGTAIGSLGFKGPPEKGAVELVFTIDTPQQKQGYAAEAVKALLSWAFAQRDVFFVIAQTPRENAAAIKVLKNSSFQLMSKRNDKEDPRWLKERPSRNRMTYFMCFGLMLGSAVGVAAGQLFAGLAIGFCLGLLVGLAQDTKEKSIRQKYKEELK
jgi:[ribosomal protein S5]-alanine N-acetyltransferase